MSLDLDITGRELTLELELASSDPTLELGLEHTAPVIHWYDGEYEVIPNFLLQTLETEGLGMREDVHVHAIPVETVINEGGGNTVTIGG